MIKFCTLFSSSSGNCTFVSSGKTKLLMDAGVSCKDISEELKCISVEPKEIQGIFITHEHSDHTKGAGTFARKYNVPVYATDETWENMEHYFTSLPEKFKKIIDKQNIEAVGDIGVKAFSIPHDAADPVGYCFFNGEKKITLATDVGHISAELEANLSGSNAVLLEANHDISMLRNGSYSYRLKQRILGDYGHLSNDNCARLALRLVKQGTRDILLGHLSAENNRPDLAYNSTCDMLEAAGAKVGHDIRLFVATKNYASCEIII